MTHLPRSTRPSPTHPPIPTPIPRPPNPSPPTPVIAPRSTLPSNPPPTSKSIAPCRSIATHLGCYPAAIRSRSANQSTPPPIPIQSSAGRFCLSELIVCVGRSINGLNRFPSIASTTHIPPTAPARRWRARSPKLVVGYGHHTHHMRTPFQHTHTPYSPNRTPIDSKTFIPSLFTINQSMTWRAGPSNDAPIDRFRTPSNGCRTPIFACERTRLPQIPAQHRQRSSHGIGRRPGPAHRGSCVRLC